jgi:hypothetical protein
LPLVTVDRFQHHHGVVDQAAHGQGQAAEREGVERVSARVQDDERDRERKRNGHRDDDGPAHALKEEQDDKRDQDERLHDLLLQAIVGVANERGLVEDGLHFHAGRQILQAATTFFTASTISSVLPPGMRSTFR